MPKIGVFDSGMGGKSVADSIQSAFPGSEVIFRDDHENLPYGLKGEAELEQLALPHLRALEGAGCDVIVVACNTLSTTIVPRIKDQFSVPLVGIVPMIKPACSTTASKIVAVCATPATLSSPRYAELKEEFGEGVTFLEPYCGDWALMIETDTVDQQKIADTIESVCDEGADVIVLGCTHYHWIEDMIKDIAHGRAEVIQPEPAIVQRVSELLKLPV